MKILDKAARLLWGQSTPPQPIFEPLPEHADQLKLMEFKVDTHGTDALIASKRGPDSVVAMLAAQIGEYFIKHGGTNYIELSFYNEKLGPMKLHIQRVQGKTPDQLKREAEEALQAMRKRVIVFAAQCQAWGHDNVADELLNEILTGPVEAPDYYKLQTELQTALTEIAHLRDALAASEQRERVATTTYDGQQSSYRELESLYSAMTERAQSLTEALHLCRENYQDTAEGMGCNAGNWDGGSSESCDHCHLLRSAAMLDAVLKQSGVEK